MRHSEKKASEQFSQLGIPFRFNHAIAIRDELRVAIAGSDTLPSLIFVHGSPGEWQDYAQFMKDPEILARYRVIAIDRPGYGGSKNHKVYHLDESVELIAAMMPSLDNGKPNIWIGHSLGGPFVVYMAKTHPELVDGLTILAGSVSPEQEAPEVWRHLLDIPQVRWILPQKFRTSNQEIMLFKKDIHLLGNDWSAITCPVLVVHGTADPLVPYANAPYIMEKLQRNTQVKLETIDGANHYLPWKFYTQVKQTLLSFFV